MQSISPNEDFIQIVYLIYTNKSSFHTKKTRNVSIRYSSLPAACDSKFLCYFNFCIFTTFPATVFLKFTFFVNLAEFSSCNFSFLLPYFESVSSKQSGTCWYEEKLMKVCEKLLRSWGFNILRRDFSTSFLRTKEKDNSNW